MMRKILMACVVLAGFVFAQQQDSTVESPEKKALRNKLESDTKTFAQSIKAYEDCVAQAKRLLGDGTIGRDFVRSQCDGEVMPEIVKKKT
jgi:hypothetical protein